MKHANVIRFDEKSAKKSGLPIIQAVTKVNMPNGESILLCAKHLIYNEDCSHTLLSNFQMREMGIIVDDMSK